VKQALRQLLSDLLSAILFLVAYAVSGSLFVAVGIAVTAGLVQLASLVDLVDTERRAGLPRSAIRRG
jgi:hypothetical protein